MCGNMLVGRDVLHYNLFIPCNKFTFYNITHIRMISTKLIFLLYLWLSMKYQHSHTLKSMTLFLKLHSFLVIMIVYYFLNVQKHSEVFNWFCIFSIQTILMCLETILWEHRTLIVSYNGFSLVCTLHLFSAT